MYRVEMSRTAEKEFAKLPTATQKRLSAKIDGLGANPRPPGCLKLSGPTEFWRVRAGDYRIVYSIDDDVLIVHVVKMGHQSDVYD